MFCDLSLFVFEEEVGVLCRNVTGISPHTTQFDKYFW